MTKLEFQPLKPSGLIELRPRRFEDQRGFFSETWNAQALREVGIQTVFVQDNHSYSARKGVLRGLHLQRGPAQQDKLVRVGRGAIFDVTVDVRRGSPTFGRWTGVVLSASEWNQLFVPVGFAHGFVTLQDDTEVQYKVSHPYSPAHELCLRYDDPALAIEWPAVDGGYTLSEKDRQGLDWQQFQGLVA